MAGTEKRTKHRRDIGIWRGRVGFGQSGLGVVRQGVARRALASLGWVRSGRASLGWVRWGVAGYGQVWLGEAGRGKAWQGEAFSHFGVINVRASENGSATALVEPSIDTNQFANDVIVQPAPTILGVTLNGVSKLLFHRYDCASVEAKGKAAKGSKQKKSDDIESYVYRDDEGYLSIPAENLHGALAISAKSFQDPRSPRKSAMDLFKAGILVLPDHLRLTRDGEPFKKWDFLDTRRVIVQQSAISRTRPGLESGWVLDADIHILLPGLISVELLRSVLVNAGNVVGLCDFRPRFGRFHVTRSELIDLD